MVYSQIKLNELKQDYKKQKSLTKKVNLTMIAVCVLLIVTLFFVRNIFIAILGGLSTLFLFSFMFYRSSEVHKTIKSEIDFYTDLVYSEKQTEDVVFIRYGDTIISNKRKFNTIVVKLLKTEKETILLYQEDFNVDFKPARYTVVKAHNILIDYKEAQND